MSGTATSLTTQPAIDATATWDLLELPGGDLGTISATNGHATLSGNAQDYEATLAGDFSAELLPIVRADIRGNGTSDGFEITQFSTAAFGGHISGAGNVTFRDQRLNLRLEGKDLNPAVVRAGLHGRLDTKLFIDARLPDRIAIDVDSVSGEFLGQSLSAAARVKANGQELAVEDLRLNAGANLLKFDGTVLPRLAGEFQVNATDLSTALARAGGEYRRFGRPAGHAGRTTRAHTFTGIQARLPRAGCRTTAGAGRD